MWRTCRMVAVLASAARRSSRSVVRERGPATISSAGARYATDRLSANKEWLAATPVAEAASVRSSVYFGATVTARCRTESRVRAPCKDCMRIQRKRRCGRGTCPGRGRGCSVTAGAPAAFGTRSPCRGSRIRGQESHGGTRKAGATVDRKERVAWELSRRRASRLQHRWGSSRTPA